MLNNLKYYFKLLFYHTRYIETLVIFILLSFTLTTSSLSLLSNNIMAEEYTNADMFPFFINIGENGSIYYSFILLLPLLVVLPIGQILVIEKKNKNLILSRTNKMKNYISKVIISFFSGFSLIFIALSCSVLYSQIILSSNIQNIHYISTTFISNSINQTKSSIGLYNLFLTNPFLVSIINMFMISIFGGIMSTISLILENIYHNKILIYCSSFIFIIINQILNGLFPTISDLLYIELRYSNYILYLFFYLIIFLISLLLSSIFYLKKDCF